MKDDPRDRVACVDCGTVFANLAEFDEHSCVKQEEEEE